MNNRFAIILLALTVAVSAQAMGFLDENETSQSETVAHKPAYCEENDRPVRKQRYENVSNWPQEYEQEESIFDAELS